MEDGSKTPEQSWILQKLKTTPACDLILNNNGDFPVRLFGGGQKGKFGCFHQCLYLVCWLSPCVCEFILIISNSLTLHSRLICFISKLKLSLFSKLNVKLLKSLLNAREVEMETMCAVKINMEVEKRTSRHLTLNKKGRKTRGPSLRLFMSNIIQHLSTSWNSNLSRSCRSHLLVGVQGRLWRVDDEVAEREAKTRGVLMEDQRPGTLPAHADPLPSRPGRHRRPRVVTGWGETIPPPLTLWTQTERERESVSICFWYV